MHADAYQDQIFTTPARNMLLSFDASIPTRAIGEITVGLEELDPHPLLLDPFTLRGGVLSWDGLEGGTSIEAM